MKIRGKLIVSYLVVVVLLGIVAMTSLFAISRVNQFNEQMYNNRLQPLGELAEVGQLAESTRVQILTSIVEQDPTRADQALTEAEEVSTLLTELGQAELYTNEREIFDRLISSWEKYVASLSQNAQLVTNGEYDRALTNVMVSADFFYTMEEDLSHLITMNLDNAGQYQVEAHETYLTNQLITLVLSGLAVIVAIGLGITMGQRIGGPMGKLSKQMHDIADGNLTGEPLVTKRKDEIGELVEATNQMQANLQNVIKSVSEATDRVSSASEELNQSANEVKQGSEQIASTMQELSTGGETQASTVTSLAEKMEIFLTRVNKANHDTKDVSDQSLSVINMTQEGRQMMEQSLQQMLTIDGIVQSAVSKVEGLDKRSQEISKLVDVIQDIAEQTNLLALNAAIEAARAGDQGKGFAVVADEVRKLAEDVSQSVREITTIINGIQAETDTVVSTLESGYTEVNQGTVQMAKTGENFNNINDSIEQMVKRIENVSSHLTEISQESTHINTSIEEIASISEQSAAGIEETAASSEQSLSAMEEVSSSANTLASLAEDLTKEVRHFQINL